MNKLFKNFNSYENSHIFIWLIKDICWCSGYHLAGVMMIVPTLVVALHIAWHHRKDLNDLFHNSAICFWICANATWMLGEFFFEDHLRNYAKIFFFCGIGLLIIYYLFLHRNYNKKLEEHNETKA